MGKITISTLLGLSLTLSAAAAGKPISVNDLLSMERISEPQLSADGTRAVYSVAVPDLAANRLIRNIWLVTLATGDTRALTSAGRDGGARWSPDGRRLAFISQRDGASQLYILDVAADGTPSEPRRLTQLSGGADNVVWSPDGQTIAFTSEVYPDCRDEACNVARDEAKEKSPVRARIYDELLYRHWTAWSEGKRLHLFVVPSNGGAARDLIPGADYDVPPPQREGPHPIAFAPDSRTICLHRRRRPRRSDQHQRRSLRGRRHRRRDAAAADNQPRLRRRASVLAGRPDDRLPVAGARGIRIRQVASDAVRSRVGTADEPD